MPQRKWSGDEKLAIVLEGLTPGANISEICRRHQVAATMYYRWRDAFLAGGKAALTGNGPSQREKKLEAELRAAQAKIGEQTMEIDILKKRRTGAGSNDSFAGQASQRARISGGPDLVRFKPQPDLLLCPPWGRKAKSP